MNMLYVLIPLALMLLAVAVWALIWAIRSGQFDDLESHGWSVVLDDDQRPPPDPEAEEDRSAEVDAASGQSSETGERSPP